ncbi:MAG TPA: sigma-70 family RNA polymerase sigma factor [Polyangiales bacterium]
MTDLSPPRINSSGSGRALSIEGHLDSAELFRRYASFVANFLARMGVARSDLDDLVQDVFLIAHRNGGYDPGPAKPTTYLAAIAFRAATTHRRKGKTRSFVKAADEIVTAAGDDRHNPERDADQKRQLAILDRALAVLDDDKRAVFVMAELQGETVVSIAAGLGIPVDTAYSRLRAARQLFREAAKQFYGEPPTSVADTMQRVGT